MINKFQDRFNSLFSSLEKNDKDELHFLMDKFYSNSIRAEKQASRQLILLYLIWIISWVINKNIISEVQLSSFKLLDVKSLLIIAPPLFGINYYNLTVSRIAIGMLTWIVKSYSKTVFPNYENHNDFIFLQLPNSATIEDYILFTEKNKFRKATTIIFMKFFFILLWIIPIIAFIHISYLLIISAYWHIPIIIVSILIGLLFKIRSIILWKSYWSSYITSIFVSKRKKPD